MNEKFLLLPILIPAISAMFISTLKFQNVKSRNIFIECSVLLNTLIILLLVLYPPSNTLTLFRLSERAGFSLRLDGLGMVFIVLIALLWPLTTLYAFEYMSHEHRQTSFFGWFVLTFGVVAGIALSSDLLTLYLFYEVMTLTTLPLVMHEMDGRGRYAGRKYLTYSVGGAACAFIALTYTMYKGGGESFMLGGTLGSPIESDNLLLSAWFLGFLGFGVKSAVFPFHSWLPSASVAPTPVSALLHAAAVVKAGIFAVTRLTWYVFGAEVLRGTWAQWAAFGLVCITIIYGSSMALATQHLKRRFAYSTISQLSYILMGVLLLTPEGLVGALTHMGGHAIMKINLFFCAGAILCQTEREYIFDMRGIGLGMPKTFLALLISGLALCGLPPSAGFMGKWQLGTAAAACSPLGHIGVAMLAISAVLTVLYVFSIFSIFIMPGKNFDFKTANKGVKDPGLQMLIPLGILAVSAFIYGLYAEPIIKFFTEISQGLI